MSIDNDITEVTINDFEANYDLDEYEVFDEKTNSWVLFKHSCYKPSGEFCKPEEAKYPINIITLYDSQKKKYFSWVLGLDTNNTISDKEVILNKFSNEISLLKDFITWFSCNYPDVITGWNTYYFDMPYIIRRIENVLGDKYAKLMSPVGKYRIQEKRSFYNKIYILLDGISQLDLKMLYEEKFKIEAALDGGYSLSNVCLHELNEDKIAYEGSMKDFYKHSFQRFFEYNIRDVELTVKLEDKLQMIPLARKITTLGLCQYEQIYGSISYIIGSLAIYSKSKHNKVFKSYSNTEHEHEKFEGAYVFNTVAGFYNKGVACIDFNSLYPNTAIALNLSPETKVGQLFDNHNGTFILKTRNASKNITKDQLNKLLDQRCILSKNNTLFYKHEIKSGIFAEWCKYFYDTRKLYQKKNKEASKELDKINKEIKSCKVSDDKKILKDRRSIAEKNKFIYHITQYALKIMLNSAYGVLGCNFSPIFDIDLAQSITLNGQFVNKAGAEYIKKRFIEKYKCPEDFNVTISGDTDSISSDSILTIKHQL